MSEHDEKPTLDDHPGLDNDEATAAGRLMTASGSTGLRGRDTDDPEDRDRRRTLDDYPGLDNDEATAAGRIMTTSGSNARRGGEGDDRVPRERLSEVADGW